MTKRKAPIVCLGGLSLVLLAGGEAQGADPAFIRGDANADGKVSISDPLMVRRHLFLGGSAPSCQEAANADDNDQIDFTDAIWSLNALFLQGATFPAPFPEVGVDPTPGGGVTCSSYEIDPAPATDDMIRLGDVTANPGQTVEIPVHLSSSVEVEAVQLAVLYDPAIITPSLKRDGFGGTPWGPPHLVDFVSLRPYPEEGIFVVGVIGSLTGTEGVELFPPIPPGEDQLIFKITGRISANAPMGTTVLLEPTNGPDGQGVHPPYYLRNELTHRGQGRYVSVVPRTLPGSIAIIGDITLFSRGDSNDDDLVDISDAMHVLGYLYLGGSTPVCLDAADADDNGRIEITDGVVILNHLFLGTSAIAAPYPALGKDLTTDNLAPCPRN